MEFTVINRVSVNVLLKSVIAALAIAVVVGLSIGAWNSWTRLAAVKRIGAVANASADIFTTLHNLRVDRSATVRGLSADQQFAVLPPLIRQMRAGDVPALAASFESLKKTEFSGQKAAVANIGDAIQKLAMIHRTSTAALMQPKAQRPAGIAKQYAHDAGAIVTLLEAISTQLIKSVALEDSYVDQLLVIKQLAWTARNAAGEASVIISNTLSGMPLPHDAMLKYTRAITETETAWTAIEGIAANLPMPARFTAALEKAKREYMGPDFTEARSKMINALVARQHVATTSGEWSKMSVSKLASLLGVADVALDSAKEYAAAQSVIASTRLWLELGLLTLAIALMVGAMLLVSRRVTGPLLQIQQAMLKVAAGDFSVVLPGLERKDEIGQVANAVERFKVLADEKARAEADEAMQRQKTEAGRQAQLAQAEAAAQAKVMEERAKTAEEQTQAVQALGVGLRKLSSGDLTYRLSGEFPEAYKELKDDFNSTMAQLQETIRALMESTSEVSSATAEISASTTDLSQRTEEQAASLEETSASMEEISVTVKKNAENAQQANQSAGATRMVADRGGQVVAQAVDAMARIEDSSRKISDIIGVIDEIARQTNLLALNAAVEAARAGEAGRGFAVVATEVRSLAQRSSQAAKDIKDLIVNSNGQVKEGVDLVNKAGMALNEIVESIKAVAGIVSDIATASIEQSTGIEQVNKALAQMDEATQQNSALVEENAATAKTLEQQARSMDERVSFFRLGATAVAQGASRGADAPPPVPTRSSAAPAAAKAKPAAPAQPAPAPAAPRRGVVGRMQAAVATAFKNDPDWSEF
jgi:methyl-accepting chemotaxis protein